MNDILLNRRLRVIFWVIKALDDVIFLQSKIDEVLVEYLNLTNLGDVKALCSVWGIVFCKL
jgi:hypothetical protein